MQFDSSLNNSVLVKQYIKRTRGFEMSFPNSLVTRVSLTISCTGLLKKDITSQSDPVVQVLLLENSATQSWKEQGRTEHIKNTSCPEFTKSIEVDYKFEEVQRIKFVVYDIDNLSTTLSDDDFLGHMECNLAQIVSSRVLTRKLIYVGNSNAGTIKIVAEEINKIGDHCVTMQFHAKKLDKKDFLSKSDPYLEILKDNGDGTFLTVHRTPHINNTLDPNWKPFTLTLQKLCGGNYDLKLMIRCFDYDDDGSHDLIGEFYTTLAEMCGQPPLQWSCINPKKQKKSKSYQNSGIIYLDSIKVFKKPTFLDYILGGCQINFTVGVDFTASNLDPLNPSSLHYINPYQRNEYEQALIAVGEVCQDYDSDKLFPALGFGAKIPPGFNVSFEFPLNFNPSNPYCAGIQGIHLAYQNCVKSIQLYGPTNVAPIIKHVTLFASNALKNQENTNLATNYFVLLLLTDGVISDMDDTVSAIVDASYLPISLIIVGVGNADFSQMNFLDCDQGKLTTSYGKQAFRDIVQFVPFRDFKHASPADLARAVLAEVPNQVTEYFELKSIQPQPPRQFVYPTATI